MPRRGGGRSRSGSQQRTQRHNRVYNNTIGTRTTRTTRNTSNPKKDKRFNMPNSSGDFKSGFSLPWLVGAYLIGSAGRMKETTVVHRDSKGAQQGGYVEGQEEQVKEVPQLSETDPCFYQYRSMMDCLEANGPESSECQSVVNLMEECAKFHSPEV